MKATHRVVAKRRRPSQPGATIAATRRPNVVVRMRTTLRPRIGARRNAGRADRRTRAPQFDDPAHRPDRARRRLSHRRAVTIRIRGHPRADRAKPPQANHLISVKRRLTVGRGHPSILE